MRNKLKKIANKIRYETIKLVHETKTAHLGSCLSCIDILVATYFSNIVFKSFLISDTGVVALFVKSSFVNPSL